MVGATAIAPEMNYDAMMLVGTFAPSSSRPHMNFPRRNPLTSGGYAGYKATSRLCLIYLAMVKLPMWLRGRAALS